MRLFVNKNRISPGVGDLSRLAVRPGEAITFVPYTRLDSILGLKQEGYDPELGYYVDSNNNLVGTKGSKEILERHSQVVLPVFTLPTFSSDRIVKSVSLYYKLDGYRQHDLDTFFTSDLYLIKSDDPTNTHLDYYYQGPEDPNPDVIFIGSNEFIEDVFTPSSNNTQIPEWEPEEDDEPSGEAIDIDPPLSLFNPLSGESIDWFLQNIYDGNVPTRDKLYFRFNRSSEDFEEDDLFGHALNRFVLVNNPIDLTLLITTTHKSNV